MATIFSSQFSGVGTVAGGFYYCAQDYLPKQIKKDAGTIGTGNLFLFEPITKAPWIRPQKGNPIYQSSICMGSPEESTLPDSYLKVNAQKKLVDPLSNLSDQKVFIYQGESDSTVKVQMQERLKSYYLSVGVKESNIATLTGKGSHNFPTDRNDGIDCNQSTVPYVASCDLNLASIILGHLFDDKMIRTEINKSHIYVVDQTTNLTRPPSIAPYGYLYANDKCLANPKSCHMHVALHGCKMSDSFNEDFQKQYQNQVLYSRIVTMGSRKTATFPGFPVIEDKTNKFGLLKFVLDSGYIDYAEENDLMILFPQTWITENNFPYNPNGCWDWFGWTGENYATNVGSEPKWLMDFIHSISANPKKHIMPELPKFNLVEKNFPRKSY